MPIPELLHDLLTARGPSGHEGARRACGATPPRRSPRCTRTRSAPRSRGCGPGDGAPTLAIIGHIDEIGVRDHERRGERPALLRHARRLPAGDRSPGQRVWIAGADGRVPRRRSARRIDRRAEARRRREASSTPTCTSTSARTTATKRGGSSRGRHRRLAGRAARAAERPCRLEVARQPARRLRRARGGAARRGGGDAQVDVVAVAAVQEELGYYGARAAAFSLDPDVALAIDVTWATDVPGGDPWRRARSSSARAPRSHAGRSSTARLRPAGATSPRRKGSRTPSRSAADARRPTPTRCTSRAAGVPTGLVSVPLRYMHSPVELGSLDDLEAVDRARRRVRAPAHRARRASCASVGPVTRSVIVSAVRTPFGKLGGGLAALPGDGARRDRDPGGARARRGSSRTSPTT